MLCPYFPMLLVSMIRKYHNHELETNPWHREEEQHNNYETDTRKTNKAKQPGLSYPLPPRHGEVAPFSVHL